MSRPVRQKYFGLKVRPGIYDTSIVESVTSDIFRSCRAFHGSFQNENKNTILCPYVAEIAREREFVNKIGWKLTGTENAEPYLRDKNATGTENAQPYLGDKNEGEYGGGGKKDILDHGFCPGRVG